MVSEVSGSALVRCSRASQRGKNVELPLGETELAKLVRELIRDCSGNAVQSADHSLWRRVEVGALTTPLGLNDVNAVLRSIHLYTISSMEGIVSSVEDKTWKWIAVTAIAPIAWGSTYFVTRQLLPADVPLWGGLLRALPAGLLVLLVARRLPTGRWWWRSILLGTLNVGGFFVLIYIAGQRLPSSVASTLMSASAGAMLLLAWLLLRQRPRVASTVGAVVGIAGVVIMLGVGGGPVDPVGVVASLGAMAASSVGFVLTTRWGAEVPALAMTSWQLIGGSVVLLPFVLLIEGAPPTLTPSAAWGFAYVTVVATAVAYVAWFAGLRHLTPAVVGMVGLLNPLTGVLLGVAIAGEVFGAPQAIGFALVVCGIMVSVLPRRRTTTGPRPEAVLSARR